MKNSRFNKSLFLAFVFIFMVFIVPKAGTEEEIQFPGPQATISMDFQDAQLKDILKVFSIQSGLNVIASEAVQDRKVTLYLDAVPVREALNKIFQANNLTYEIDAKSNIIIVKDWGKPTVDLKTEVFHLKYNRLSNSRINSEINNFLNQLQTSTTTNYGVSSVYGSNSSTSGSTNNNTSEGAKIDGDEGISQTIKKILSPAGIISEDIRSNSLIVTDVPSRFAVIEATIAALDVPVPQILLEVEMLDVNKNAMDNIGFEYGSTPFTITLQGGLQTMGFPFGNWSKLIGDTVSGKVGINQGTTDSPAYSVAFNYLRTLTDTKVLARPRILTLSNETAEIKIITNEAIGVTNTTATAGGTTGVQTQQAERAETGVALRITPQVNSATGEITMFVIPAVANATTGNTFTSGGDTFSFNNPEVRTTKSVVRVRDGDTIVLGGLIRRDYAETTKKLPILGDIPLLGALFRNKNKTADKDRELLVFITPRIIKDSTMTLAKAADLGMPLSAREQEPMPIVGRSQAINKALHEYTNE